VPEPAVLVAMRGIVKDFPGVRANDGIDFDLRAGEVHALLGENGAGKTTLANLLAGLHRPDAGVIEIRGEPVELRSPRQAIDRGIGMVHQHFKLVRRFTGAENLTLGWHSPRGLIRRRPLEREIAKLADSYGIQVRPERPVWQLTVGEQQRVELLKNLYRGADVLVLDEPTAVLAPQEAEALFGTLRRMAAEGRGVVLITHKLDEVLAASDRVTVLRRGRHVATVSTRSTTSSELARLMIGAEPVRAVRGARTAAGRIVFRVVGLEAEDERGVEVLRGIDLDVREGEILGLAGVAGNGQRELAEVLVGLRHARDGRVLFHEREITRWPTRRRLEAGIGYVPEDRLGQGIAPGLSVADNLVARSYRDESLGGRFVLSPGRARRAAEELISRFDIRGAGLDAPAATLSGGNLQKLVLARELSADPALLVASQPTRGLDVGAAETVRRLLLEQREAGRSLLLVSEDLDELLSLSDRIAVIHAGRINGVFSAPDFDVHDIGLRMAGQGA
jgi:general nucleoside transport system ATP-binding protein